MKIAFIGAGSMAEALISGIITQKLVSGNNVWVTNKCNQEKLYELQQSYGVNISYDIKDILSHVNIVCLAMKPKDVGEAIQSIRAYLRKDMLIVSVLAGVSITSIEEMVDTDLAIVRAMPNTSATIGKSASALAINHNVNHLQLETVKGMFETVGLTTIVKEEDLDAVTGLSGSGPAYIYYLVEAMEKSAVEIGLEKEVAKKFIIQTLIGAAEMLERSSKESAQLRKEVTSPGGTTEAGLKVLEAHAVQEAFVECIKAATAQSKKLGEIFANNMKV
ncbi:pyrroline-5-carboxylate reductase [Cytobacillus sp. FSL W7-1323]|uniref:Pyrroline-5-carboxylate reductase n=1 Tax=Cytobacillus kochii TaxID=859143 RepID=A0A248TLS6_9BACI|nr:MULTISPECIES: pyrroline-5-carboxylate reductase [Cytobacillus]ASV69101.1 pyrroline-5-carboxylate reductase [Cytobacillus kochii]MDQ0183819.1 pyrroline-5-carboxylate reductase [Cytobacillus kochii]MEA1852990.1 pyrroline-5-carboxylate reductase [Cytobacillus sp. OWB-43]MED1604137.1 pyrroline-5-carboxylate reductase [Cytobacillus kochii]